MSQDRIVRRWLFLEPASQGSHAKRPRSVRQSHTVQSLRFPVEVSGGTGDEESSEKAIQ